MQTLRSSAQALALILALTHLGGCARAEDAFEPTPAVADAMAPAPSAAPASEQGAKATDQRKIVREGELTLEVDSVDAFRPLLEAELDAVGGHITDASVQHVDGKAVSSRCAYRKTRSRFLRPSAAAGASSRRKIFAPARSPPSTKTKARGSRTLAPWNSASWPWWTPEPTR
jgi:hypothetical protein